jgi:hypothetical protein
MVSRAGRRGKQAGERGFELGFIGGHGLVEERERGGGGSHGPSPGQRAAPACSAVRGSRSASATRRGKARGGQ